MSAQAGIKECRACLGWHRDGATCQVQSEALKADAERLAELRAELRKSEQKDWAQDDAVSTRTQMLNALIAMYEECAARGIAFGGGR